MSLNNEQFQRLYQSQLREGQEYQDFITRLLLQRKGIVLMQTVSRSCQNSIGETLSGYEIKYDKEYHRTGNLWIEVAEKASIREGPYAKSGIYRDDNAFMWVIGDRQNVFVILKKLLIAEAEAISTRIIENKLKTSKGFTLPGSRAKRLSAMVIHPTREDKSIESDERMEEMRKEAAELRSMLLSNPRQTKLF